jgi:hypothetical protein
MNFCSMIAIIITLSILAGCKSTNTKSKGWNVTMGGCKSRIHPTKINPTADYKACSFNYNQVTAEVDACMINQGWSEMQDMPCSNVSKFYTSEQINGCLNSSKEDGKVSHKKINSCLVKFEEYEADLDKSKDSIQKVLEERTN